MQALRFRRFCSAIFAPAAFAILVSLPAWNALAQTSTTQLLSIFPPGGKAGATVDLQLTGGKELAEVDALVFTHPEITAAQKTTDLGGLKRPVAQQFTVTIGPNVLPGVYEVRAKGFFGVSNPRRFVVSAQNEIQETESNNNVEQAGEIQLGDVVNGRSNGGRDVDVFKFAGKQGQRILVECQAIAIDSRMKANLRVFDAAGKLLGYSRARFEKDPLVDVTLPADGEYFIRVHDFIYNGSNEYVYRLRAHTGPHIDYILPPAGKPGSNGNYTLYGRNLPGGQPASVSVDGRELQKLTVQIPLPRDPAVLETKQIVAPHSAGVDGVSYSLDSPAGRSNPVLIQLATADVALEQEPNNEPGQANKLTVPGEFAGQFQERGDVDVFTFEAKAGEVYYVEVFGERLGNSADPYFVLEQITRNDQGEESVRRIQAQDDDGTNLLQNIFNTPTHDPVYRFQVPADGEYRLSLRDRYFETRGDPRLVYRLCIRKEQPDFRVVVVPYVPGNNNASDPGAIVLRKSDNVSVQVVAFRRDGFDGAIDVTVEGLPAGVTCSGAVIGPGQTSTELILASAENAAEWFGQIKVVGKARIDDPEKVRAVEQAKNAIKPATDALPKLNQDAQKAAEELDKANNALAAAKEELAAKPDDEGLKKKVEAAQKAVEAAQQAANKANEAKAAGEKRLADAEAAVAKAEAERQAAIQEVTRQARTATIVWQGNQNQPAFARVSESCGLSVIEEALPFQLTHEVPRVEANQGRQILVPVKMAKREGFVDADVTLQFTGLPRNSNIAVQNQKIAKGQDSELCRVFVNNNAPPGAYTLYLKGQGKIKYSRHPQKVEQLKKEQEQLTKAATDAAEALKQANQTRDAAVKAATDAANAVKTAETAKTQADQKAKAAQDALKKAADEKAAAEKAATDAQAAAEQAAAKAEEAKKAAEAQPDNKELADAKAAAEKAATESAENAKKAADAKAAAEKAFNEADAAAKTAAEEQTAAQKALEEAQKAATAAEEAKVKSEQAAKDADAKSKAAAAVKATIDKEVQDAEKAAAPKDINVTIISTPIVITVKPAPAQLSASVPSGGNIKRGDKLEVKVTVNRVNGFAGPVTLTLPLPPGVAGLSAEPVEVPADQKEGVLTIAAAGDATEGQLQHMVIRGTADFDGEKAAVDVAVNLKVSN